MGLKARQTRTRTTFLSNYKILRFCPIEIIKLSNMIANFIKKDENSADAINFILLSISGRKTSLS